MGVEAKIEAATLHSAMALAFGEIEAATKAAAGQVGQQRYKYADIGAVIDAIKPALVKHGLFFTQNTHPSENGVAVETVLHHASGESMSLGKLFVPADRNNAQGFGSALTYCRRYGLVTAFGVPTEDDDGNAASRREGQSGSDRAVSPPAEMPDSEWAKLVQLLEATNADTKAMLDYYKVQNLRQLDQDQYGHAVKSLTDKLAKLAKDETDAKAGNLSEAIDDAINF